MHGKSLFVRLFLSFLLVILLAVATLTRHGLQVDRRFYEANKQTELVAAARLIERQVRDKLAPSARPSLQSDVVDCERLTALRVTVILPSGEVIADSEEDPTRMFEHRDRPEVRAALAGAVGFDQRYSATRRRNLLYAAVPMVRDRAVVGAVRVAVAQQSLEQAFAAAVSKRVLGYAAMLVGLAALLSLYLIRRISRPVQRMKAVADEFARGNLRGKLEIPDTRELAALAKSMNQLAGQLGEKTRTIDRFLVQQKALFASMQEGLLVLDSRGVIVDLNSAAAEILETDADQARGRHAFEIVMNHSLSEFITQVLDSAAPSEGEVVLHGEPERRLLLRGAPLRAEDQPPQGALIMLIDVSRLGTN